MGRKNDGIAAFQVVAALARVEDGVAILGIIAMLAASVEYPP